MYSCIHQIFLNVFLFVIYRYTFIPHVSGPINGGNLLNLVHKLLRKNFDNFKYMKSFYIAMDTSTQTNLKRHGRN